MQVKKYKLSGQIVDKADKRGVPGILVEAWDKDVKHSDLLGSTFTTHDGLFVMQFDSTYFADHFKDGEPDVFFRLFFNNAQIHSTEDSVIHNMKDEDTSVTIAIRSPRLYTGENVFERVPQELKKELFSLKAHDKRITEKLKDKATAAAFFEDPGKVLAEMDISLSSHVKKRLKQSIHPKDFLTQRAFRLPTGQIITPKVTINFTTSKEVENVG